MVMFPQLMILTKRKLVINSYKKATSLATIWFPAKIVPKKSKCYISNQ